jgi:serine/threonine protein kinase/Flp pilus assembly protein TadD
MSRLSPEAVDSDPGERSIPSFARVRAVKRELLNELRVRHTDGDAVRAEQLLPRWPTDPSRDPDIASLLFEEFNQRRQHGDEPSVAELEERFPQHKHSLAGLIRVHDVIHSTGGSAISAPTLALPDVGDEVFGFRLERELGRGAFARVFLARQANLADRPVVLKISAVEGTEPQTLAQLQHTHIVPIYSVHEDARAGLRAVCMPYFGGASLSQVLRKLFDTTERPRTGQELAQALSEVSGPLSVAAPQKPAGADDAEAIEDNGHRATDKKALQQWRHGSYIQAVAWLTARLAEALQHAHDRGVLHRDIKPSNILLGDDGQPLLLDFNLAQLTRDERAQAMLGGTVAYMAPEHLRALAARDPALARRIDQRADVYSLGMVLFETLLGHRPFDQSGSYCPLPALIEAMAVERGKRTPSLRQAWAEVPWSLESIARKCLAPDPQQRYQQAEQLAEDLQRFLDDRPLRYAPELSKVERVRKWTRRHPRLTYAGAVAGVAVAVVLVLGGALVAVSRQFVDTAADLAAKREQLETADAKKRKQAYEDGIARVLYLVNTTQELRDDHIEAGLAACKETLALYDILEREDWQQHPDWRRLDTADQQRLAEDTRELLVLLAWARVRQTPEDPAVLRDALVLLDRADAVQDLSPSPAVWQYRGFYFDHLKQPEQARAARQRARELPPVNARDHYLLATAHAREGRYEEALVELDKALKLNPQHYWSLFQKGSCHEQLRQYPLAIAAFSGCIALGPDVPFAYFARGYVFGRSGYNVDAIHDFTAALEHDPRLLQAYWNRGNALLEQLQFAASLRDFDKAAELGRDDAELDFVRGVALEGLGREEKSTDRFAAADQAFARALARARPQPEFHVRLLARYGVAVSERLPERARQAFAEVLRLDAQDLNALYGMGSLLAPTRPTEALSYFNKAVKADPSSVSARRFRAMMYAKLQSFLDAEMDMLWCLQREPESGKSYYTAACIWALAVKVDPSQADQALEYLRQAFQLGYGRDRAENDDDLANLRNLPRFRALLQTGS